MRRFAPACCTMLAALVCPAGPARAGVSAAPAALPPVSAALTPVGGARCWFYSSLIPWPGQGVPFVGISIEPDGLRSSRGRTPPPPLAHQVWLDFWEIQGGGTSLVGQALRVGDYHYARDVPFPVYDGQEVYLFFLRSLADVKPAAPVGRWVPYAWAWQRLDTVEAPIRRRALFADFEKGKVYNGMGEVVADLSGVKAKLPASASLVGIDCKLDGHGASGFAAELAPTATDPAAGQPRPPLPYRHIYFWRQGPAGASATDLPFVSSPGQGAPGSAEPVGAAAAVEEDYFGMPVRDPRDPGVCYYWCCTQRGAKEETRNYALVRYDGRAAGTLDAFTYTSRGQLVVSARDAGGELKQPVCLYWEYGPALNIEVQPLVGTDVNRNVIVYRPPVLFRVAQAAGPAGSIPAGK